jgi:hypothetical protein
MSAASCVVVVVCEFQSGHITPCPQKGTKKTYEIFFIAFELSIVFCSPWVFGTFLGTGRDIVVTSGIDNADLV